MKNIFYITFVVSLLSFSSKAQSINKDTLFFKFDKNYIVTYEVTPNNYYLRDSNSGGTFYFQKKETIYNLKPKKIKCLKKFIRTSEFYRKDFNRKLEDYSLYEYLRIYTIFLVNKNEFIEVQSSFEID